jgi:NADH:ubiquinone oxidoreductase subunit 5 (subunit L)/multisubunit Na+/H+ antiporter MnhA subunit
MGLIVRPTRDQLAAIANGSNQTILDRTVDAAGIATLAMGNVAYRGVDQPLIDGAVNGVARLMGLAGAKLRFWQTGSVQRYAVALFIGVAGFVGAFVIARL